jgi:hypothetical protein
VGAGGVVCQYKCSASLTADHSPSADKAAASTAPSPRRHLEVRPIIGIEAGLVSRRCRGKLLLESSHHLADSQQQIRCCGISWSGSSNSSSNRCCGSSRSRRTIVWHSDTDYATPWCLACLHTPSSSSTPLCNSSSSSGCCLRLRQCLGRYVVQQHRGLASECSSGSRFQVMQCSPHLHLDSLA